MAVCKRYLQYNNRAAAKGMATSLRRKGYFVQTRKSRSRSYGTTWTVYTCGRRTGRR
jgi:hypothetical protein